LRSGQDSMGPDMRRAMARSTRTLRAVAILLVAGTFLSGCILADRDEQHYALALGLESWSLAIAVCERIDFDRLVGNSRNGAEQWDEFWSYEGDLVTVEAGDIISAATADELGLPLPIANLDPVPGSWITLSLQGGATGRQAAFKVPEGGLQEGVWVRTDRLEYEEPCV
jgi:hypothetical protein